MLANDEIKMNTHIRHCFILGIAERSGTNYLSSLLKLHPNCHTVGPIWEDHFMLYSSHLTHFTKRVYASWKKKWQVEEKIGPPEVLLQHFGTALKDFLNRQLG